MKKKKTILALKCAKCGAIYMANNLTYGIAEWLGDEVKDAITKGDEVFLTDCATLSMCECKDNV